MCDARWDHSGPWSHRGKTGVFMNAMDRHRPCISEESWLLRRGNMPRCIGSPKGVAKSVQQQPRKTAFLR